MRIHIRQTTDVHLLLELDQRCFPYDERIDMSVGIWWVAYHGDTPVGFSGLKDIGFNDDHRGLNPARTVFLSRCGVLPMYQGFGLQQRLVQVRVRWARKRGFRRAVTYTEFRNIASQRNLQKEGFLLYRPYRNWGELENALYWMLEL